MGRGRDSVTSGRNLEPGGQGWPNAAALTCFLEIVFPLTACISCCFLGGGKEDVRKRRGLGVGRLLRGVGVGRGCEAARVLCVPEVQVWLGGMECSLLPSKSRNSCGRA